MFAITISVYIVFLLHEPPQIQQLISKNWKKKTVVACNIVTVRTFWASVHEIFRASFFLLAKEDERRLCRVTKATSRPLESSISLDLSPETGAGRKQTASLMRRSVASSQQGANSTRLSLDLVRPLEGKPHHNNPSDL